MDSLECPVRRRCFSRSMCFRSRITRSVCSKKRGQAGKERFGGGKWLSQRCPVWCECAVLWQAGKIHIKVSLKERFSAADGDAAAPAPVTPVAECLAKKCFRGDFLRTGVFRWARNAFGKSGCAGSVGGVVREGKSLWQYPCIRLWQ